MSTPHPAALAAGGVAIAFGLAALVAVAPHPEPRLVATPIESHDHGHAYHPPINQPYTTAVDLCLDRPGKAQIVEATSPDGSPKVHRLGQAGGASTTVTAECSEAGGEHGAHGQRVPVVLEGFSPSGSRHTVVRLTYTLEGEEGTHQTDAILPAMTQRPV